MTSSPFPPGTSSAKTSLHDMPQISTPTHVTDYTQCHLDFNISGKANFIGNPT
jgi:hypothetical protein